MADAVQIPPYGPIVVTTQPGDDEATAARRQQTQAFLALARTRWKLSSEATNANRLARFEDRQFRASKQWPQDVEQSRAIEGKPTITTNRLTGFIKQVTNQQRFMRPAIQVVPKGSGARQDIAEYFQGLVRDVEVESDADIAYTTAGEHQAEMGLGWLRIITEDVDDESFDQEIRIKRVRNPFTVYYDPTCQELDMSDARFLFLVEDIPLDEFKARYGQDAFQSLTEFQSVGDIMPDWMPVGRVRVAEYFYVEDEPRELLAVQLPAFSDPANPLVQATPRTITVDARAFDPAEVPGAVVISRRTKRTKRVYWALISATRVLDGNDARTAGRRWPGRWIPVIPVVGDEIDLDGKVDYRGIVRDAKGPQMAYNVMISAAIEAVGMAPKAPYVIAVGQLEGVKEFWETSNRRAWPYLPYKEKSVDGHLVGAPQRQSYEPPIQAVVQMIQQADQDLRHVTSGYEPSQGEQKRDQSGKAIGLLQRQSEVSNSHYLDNLGRAVRHAGRIIIDLAQQIYDTTRAVRIRGEDESSKFVVHAPGGQVPPDFQAPAGAKVVDLSVGRYDVAIKVGPSFLSKREEALSKLGDIFTAKPELFGVIGDIWAGNLDAPFAKDLERRLKKMLPPQLQDELGEGLPEDLPPQVRAALETSRQQVQQLSQALQEATQALAEEKQKIESQATLKREEMASEERIVALRVRADLLKQEIKLEGDKVLATLRGELERLKQTTDHLHETHRHERALEAEDARLLFDAAQQQGSEGGGDQGSVGVA